MRLEKKVAANYLGSFDVATEDSPFKDFTQNDWAMYFIGSYGQIDGGHHKQWVLDQVARILKGTPVKVSQRRWGPSDEYPKGLIEHDANTGDPSPEYLAWVEEMRGEWLEEDECYEYGYEEGIAP